MSVHYETVVDPLRLWLAIIVTVINVKSVLIF